MDVVSRLPAAKELFEDGLGWDGVVYSEEDKAALEKLKTQMSDEQYLVERKWLLERVDALK